NDLGLPLAIRELAASVATRASLELAVQVPERLGNLTLAVEQCIYRVAQEAIANVAQHAEARHMSVQLEQIDGWLRLTVTDDG
ncbi:MAG: sensor histidine kinase, partial [Ardenticatenaceae bacterium]